MKQEPVAWIIQSKYGTPTIVWNGEPIKYNSNIVKQDDIPLYTAPKDLSDAEIMEVYKEVSEPFGEKRLYEIHDFARALLKKASEKWLHFQAIRQHCI